MVPFEASLVHCLFPSHNITPPKEHYNTMKFQRLFSLALLPVAGSYAQTPPASVTITNTTIPAPTASPLPPVSPTVEAFIGELSTAILYASLIGNDNDLAALCTLVNPPALSNITGVNGEIVRDQVCRVVRLLAQTSAFGEQVILENQRGVSLLTTALFAVQVAGNFAGGTNLNTLCSEIEAELINILFIGYIDNFGTKIKDYICNAANLTSPTTTYAAPTLPSTTTESCTLPTGFANEVVLAPADLVNDHFYPAQEFYEAHTLFDLVDLNNDLPEAVIASFCLDKCIAYSSTGGNRTCLSIFVDQGRPYPPGRLGNDTALRWFCSGYDTALSADVYSKIDTRDSFLYGLGVNRVCNGTYRAY